MVTNDDDLSGWHDDPVLRALTGPATGDELAGEAEALAAFRAAVPSRSRRRYVGRLGIGGSALGIAVALSGGVAAAYTSSLPASVQRIANDVLQPIAPAYDPISLHHKQNAGAKHSTTPSASPRPTTVGTPSPPSVPVVTSLTVKPSPTSSGHHATGVTPKQKSKSKRAVPPTVSPTPTPTATPTPTPTPTATATPTPTPTPTTTPTPVVPASITIALGSGNVAAGGTVSVFGHLASASGAPVADTRVWLLERIVGQDSVSQVAMGVTGTDGSISFTSPVLTSTARFRLAAAHRLRSASLTAVVEPTVTASVTAQGSTYSVNVTTDGGNDGDTVMLQRRMNGDWEPVANGALDGSGEATFSVPAPAKRTLRYRVVLPRTPEHAYAQTTFFTPPD